MPFKDYSSTRTQNTELEGSVFIGPNMDRNNVRPALQQLAADGRDLYDEMVARGAGGALPAFIASGVGAVERSVQSKLRERPVSVTDFGAVADTTDDQSAAFVLAAEACRELGSRAVLEIPLGDFRIETPLDLTEIANIRCEGRIYSTVTGANAAVTIGTIVNANTVMDDGSISLAVYAVAATNSSNAGTTGIRVRGASRCNFRLYSYYWDKAVELAPVGGVGIQYLSWNTFQIYTNFSHEGLSFNSTFASGYGYINENTFIRADCSNQADALAGDSVGVYFRNGGYASNKNIFLDGSVEGQDVPVRFDAGTHNYLNLRFEGAGPVIFGAPGEATDKTVYDNIVTGMYPSGSAGIAATWNANRPNVCYFGAGLNWAEVARLSFNDFYTIGSAIYSHKWKGTASGTGLMTGAALDATNQTFTLGSGNEAYIDIPVEKGDVLRLAFSYETSARLLTFRALDAARAVLPALTAGQTPYIGSDATSNVSGLSGTAATWDHNDAAFGNPCFLSINRDTVKYLRVVLRSGTVYRSLLLEKLVRGGLQNRITSGFPPIKSITSTADPSDYPGQLAFLNADEPLIGASGGTWKKITVTTP